MHLSNVLDLSRAQFAMTAIFHIMWPILTISLSAFLVLVEVLWLRTGKVGYYRHARFWSKLLVLNFAVGVVSGIPMEFQFGTNWAGFSRYSGQFFGNILGFEGAMAFMLEAGFIGVMLLGWGRVPRAVHLFATSMVALGSSISAFWIMVANSWMQTPAGVTVENGKIVVTDYAAAIFNPDMVWGVTHMWVAAIETGMFVIAGISAWNLFKCSCSSRRSRSGWAIRAAAACSRRNRPKAPQSKDTGSRTSPAPPRHGRCSRGRTSRRSATTGQSKCPAC
jgi:cytochrome d ubiquinol oxidase subunit I